MENTTSSQNSPNVMQAIRNIHAHIILSVWIIIVWIVALLKQVVFNPSAWLSLLHVSIICSWDFMHEYTVKT